MAFRWHIHEKMCDPFSCFGMLVLMRLMYPSSSATACIGRNSPRTKSAHAGSVSGRAGTVPTARCPLLSRAGHAAEWRRRARARQGREIALRNPRRADARLSSLPGRGLLHAGGCIPGARRVWTGQSPG